MSTPELGWALLTSSGVGNMRSRQMSQTPPLLAARCEYGPNKVVYLKGGGEGGLGS